MKHTPGPWTKVKPHRIMVFDAEVNDWLTLAEIYGDTTDEIDANSNLFMAAPALLEACKAVTKCHGFEPEEPYGKLVLAAIKQAEGK